MTTLERVRRLAASQQREKVLPKAKAKVTTAEDRQELVKVAEKVIAQHRDVLMALKDR